jgi:hypothetical protein
MINTIKESVSTVGVAISGALGIQFINLIDISQILQLIGQSVIGVLTIVYLVYKIINEKKK